MKRNQIVFLLGILFLGLATQCQKSEQNLQINLEEGFVNPPDDARPRVWWHWMNGNITKDGIQKDIEWMHRSGIRGFQNFDAAFMTPQIVENRLVYMTPEWKDAFSFTAKLADSLGMEMAIAGSPGWSESGGPWVPAIEGMKKMVWTETVIEGGRLFSGVLPHPPTASGSFQNVGHSVGFTLGGDAPHIPEYYADAAVLAYKIPEADLTMKELNPKVTSSGGKFSLDMLTDGDLVKSSNLPSAKEGQKSWIQFEFNLPQTIASVSMVGGGNVGRFGMGNSTEERWLEASDDGIAFKEVAQITIGGVNQNTVSFDPVSAKFFRVTITMPPANNVSMNIPGLGDISAALGGNRGPGGTEIAEIVLHSVNRINHFEQKAGFAVLTKVEELKTPETNLSNAIETAQVIDISDKMTEDGTLNWTAPEGKWNVIRLGYSLTGHQNSPASPEATGLEVDKLNAGYVRKYFTNYLDQYLDATGGLMGAKGLQYIITDSWEAGVSNWTDNMIEEFNKRNTYDIKPWLPVLTGKIVGSTAASEKFLWDYRNTLEAMVAEYHYDELSKILKERGMGRYTESHEDRRAFIGDGMEVKKNADIPMSATWTPGALGRTADQGIDPRHESDIRESASVAHIYGKKYVAAESLTAIGNSFSFDPAKLKPTADFMLASGLNRFVIHTSVHQPVDDKIPGLGLGPFGQWFTRHETWAEQARPWMDYLSRSSYMLQQGEFVADVLYIYGQGSNLTSLFAHEMPPVPEGYNYDYLNAGAVPNVLSVSEGEITAGEMSYKILVLDESTRYMTLPVLKKIQELVNAGAKVLGPKPINTPSLNDDELEFKTIADELWDSGKAHSGISIEDFLNQQNVSPDFITENTIENGKLDYVHRTLGNQEFYWINTSSKEKQSVEVSLRISGMKPELWNPINGKISDVSYSMENERTNVSFDMAPEDAVFIVFRNKTNVKTLELPAVSETQLATLSADWTVNFEPERGAPASATFSQLNAWNENEDPGIKYFSGTAVYTANIDVPEEWLADKANICLDLGEVKNLARVSINGKDLGIIWKKPFRISISEALQAGTNELAIQVTNLWVNRLIGDAQPDAKEKITYTTMPFYRADSPLLSSGLLGPVQLIKTN